MSAVYDSWTWSRRRVVLMLAGLMAVALLAGGAGGYMFRGASTLVVTGTTLAIPAQAHAVTGPLTEPHDVMPRTLTTVASGVHSVTGPLTEPHDVITRTVNTVSRGLNADSSSGY